MNNRIQVKTVNSGTREKILAAAYSCFSEEGYSSASISKIAKRAKVLSGSIYWAFETKEKLFSEVLRMTGDQFLSSLSFSFQFENGKLINAEEIIPSMLKNFGRGPDFLRLFLAVAVESNASGNEVITVAKEIRAECRAMIEKSIESNVKNLAPEIVSLNAQRISTMVIQLLDGLYVASKIENNDVDIEIYLRNILAFIDHEVQRLNGL